MNGELFKVIKYATEVTDRRLENANNSGQVEAIRRSQAVVEFSMDGRILNANELFLDAMSYQLDEIEGEHHRMFIDKHETDASEYETFWRKLRKGESLSGQFKRIDKEGNCLTSAPLGHIEVFA